MKSRITTYVLLTAVFAVWGFIAWKIFFSRTDAADASIQTATRSETNPMEKEKLLLDYKDPFLKDAVPTKPLRSAIVPVNRGTRAVPSKRPVPPKESPPVKYTGIIRAGGRVSYLFDQDGLQHALIPGEEMAGYRLTEAWPDSVTLTKNGETFTIRMQR